MHHGANRSVNALMLIQLFGLQCLNATSGAFIGLDRGFLNLSFSFMEEEKNEEREKKKSKKQEKEKKEQISLPLESFGHKFKGTVAIRHHDKGKQTDESSKTWVPAWELVFLKWPQESQRFCPSKLLLSLTTQPESTGQGLAQRGTCPQLLQRFHK